MTETGGTTDAVARPALADLRGPDLSPPAADALRLLGVAGG